ncbi:hypothetical protein CR513_28362, partial [Mucuna pruriens]
MGPSPDEWCEFHRTSRHMIKNCRTLQSQIEKLIRSSHLGRFVEGRDKSKTIIDQMRDQRGKGVQDKERRRNKGECNKNRNNASSKDRSQIKQLTPPIGEPSLQSLGEE